MVKCLFDQLKLHGVVLAWGLTAVLGVLIHLPALELVVWRTGLAAAALGVITPFLGGRLRLPLRPRSPPPSPQRGRRSRAFRER